MGGGLLSRELNLKMEVELPEGTKECRVVIFITIRGIGAFTTFI